MDNNAKDIFLRNKILIIWITLLILILGTVTTMYAMGYRLKRNLTVGKVGELQLIVELPDTDVYINQSKKITTREENELLSLLFSPKKHSVIVSHDGYFPWKKDFIVPSDGEIKLSPFFVAQNPSGQIITTNDPEYWSIRSKIIRDIPPSEETPLLSPDGLVEIWVTDNMITARMGSTTKEIIQPDTVIRNVSFYKNRNDVLVFSTSNGVYAIEVDNNGGQNFMPIYKGQKPSFIKSDSNFIYVLDMDTLMQVVI